MDHSKDIKAGYVNIALHADSANMAIHAGDEIFFFFYEGEAGLSSKKVGFKGRDATSRLSIRSSGYLRSLFSGKGCVNYDICSSSTQ
jgi:hypothetical protein